VSRQGRNAPQGPVSPRPTFQPARWASAAGRRCYAVGRTAPARLAPLRLQNPNLSMMLAAFPSSDGHPAGLGERFAFPLKGGQNAPVEARRALLARATELPAPVRDDLLLLLTELVTNAVVHAGVGPERSLETEIREWPGRVRVEVTDPSTGTASFGARSDGDSKGGWGLFLVGQIADRWGVRRTPTGTCVWFELSV
jgi:anti-sigma regulatory factor (Ser/Thr protein kinase)